MLQSAPQFTPAPFGTEIKNRLLFHVTNKEILERLQPKVLRMIVAHTLVRAEYDYPNGYQNTNN
jgi:hypothetical protein